MENTDKLPVEKSLVVGSQEYIDFINAEKGKWAMAYKEDNATKLEAERESIREELRKELNPEESPLEKKVRELEERNSTREKELLSRDLKDSLRKKAKEIGMDQSRADRYAVFGTEAEANMIADYEYTNDIITKAIDGKIKGSFDTTPPKAGGDKETKYEMKDLKGMSRDEIRELAKKGLINGY